MIFGDHHAVFEYISEADVARHGIWAINRRFIKSNHQPEWTRDHARDLYLREVARGRDEYWQEVDFTFYWQGNLYVLRLQHSAGGVRGGDGWASYELVTLSPEPADTSDREQLLIDLKEALIAYGAGGVFADMTVTKMSFNF